MSTQETTNAGPPFDNPKADVILRSCDNVDFRTFKLLLTLVSPIFEDMFGMEQQPSEDSINEMIDGAPVVSLEEKSMTLGKLLGFCHPNGPPVEVDKLEDLKDLLAAAVKYDMDALLSRIAVNLVAPKFLDEDPVRVYAIACRFKLENEARISARATLRIPLAGRPCLEELDHITGATLHRLVQYHEQCAAAATFLTANFEWIINRHHCWWSCRVCSRDQGDLCTVWWMSYMNERSKKLAIRPYADTFQNSTFGMLNSIVQKTASCKQGCSKNALNEVQGIDKKFCVAIEDAVSKVTLLV